MKPPPAITTTTSRSRLKLGIAAVLAVVGAGAFFTIWRGGPSQEIASSVRRQVAARDLKSARTSITQWLAREPRAADAYALLARVEVAEGHDQEAVNALARAVDLGYPPLKLAPFFAVVQSRSENYDQAEPVLRLALAETEEPMPEVAQALARVYLKTFRLKEAAQPIARWMKDAPDDPTPYLYRNEIDTRSDADHAVIIQNYKAALERDPSLAAARLGLAERLRQANRLDEAVTEFNLYMKLKPDDPEGFVGAGRTALVLGQSDVAAGYFDRALELDPKEIVALKERGTIDLKNRKFASACDRFRKVLAIDPYDPDTHYNLARALQRLGDEAQGRGDSATAQSLQDEARAADALAQSLRGDHTQMADMQSALVTRPKDLELRLKIARWLLEHGRDEQGLSFCELILKDHPGNPTAIDLLIRHYDRIKDVGKANYYRLLQRQVP